MVTYNATAFFFFYFHDVVEAGSFFELCHQYFSIRLESNNLNKMN